MLPTVNIKTSVQRNMQRQNASTIIGTNRTANKDTQDCVDMETSILSKTKILEMKRVHMKTNQFKRRV